MITELFVRDPDGVVSNPIVDLSSFTMIERRRNVGSWSIKMPTSLRSAELGQPGYGIVVERNGSEIFAGPVNQIEPQWAIDTDETIISGFSDEIVLADQLVYPCDPDWTDVDGKVFPDDAYDVRPGLSETVMKEYVTQNFLDADRRVASMPSIAVAADALRGSAVIGRGRFQYLLDLLVELAVSGGDLNFFVRNGEFDVYVPRDLRSSQVFSVESGNLESYNFQRKAPMATDAISAGGGQDVDRVFARSRDTAAEALWRRHIESFNDARDTSNLTELTQRSERVILDGAEITAVDLKAIDVPNREYGKDWNVSDYVTIGDIDAVIREAQLTLDENGETVTPTIDSVTTITARNAIVLYDSVRALKRQLNDLQRNY